MCTPSASALLSVRCPALASARRMQSRLGTCITGRAGASVQATCVLTCCRFAHRRETRSRIPLGPAARIGRRHSHECVARCARTNAPRQMARLGQCALGLWLARSRAGPQSGPQKRESEHWRVQIWPSRPRDACVGDLQAFCAATYGSKGRHCVSLLSGHHHSIVLGGTANHAHPKFNGGRDEHSAPTAMTPESRR